LEEKGKVYAGRYEIAEEVGRGGMAVVYRASDRRMRRTVALKVLYPFLAQKKENKVRFQREAQVVANLDHRNIVKIFDYSGIESDENYIVAEFIEGTTLKRFVSDHPLLVPELGAMIAHEVAAALEHAHRNRVIHRDVKPENVMIGRDGAVKLMDFGIAQIKDVQQMTVTGTMIGSPAHMSPEHIEGRKLDHRADIFSLGTLLYTLCVGNLPFRAESAHALFKRILDANYVPAAQANPCVGKTLSAIIDRCLKREPEERYQSCSEVARDLVAYLAESGIEDCQRELALYFNNPQLHQETLRNRVVERLLQRARSGVRSGRLGEALSLYDRALSLDPDRNEIFDELDRVRRNVELKRALLRYVAPTAVVALLTTGGWIALDSGWISLGASQEEGRSLAVLGEQAQDAEEEKSKGAHEANGSTHALLRPEDVVPTSGLDVLAPAPARDVAIAMDSTPSTAPETGTPVPRNVRRYRFLENAARLRGMKGVVSSLPSTLDVARSRLFPRGIPVQEGIGATPEGVVDAGERPAGNGGGAADSGKPGEHGSRPGNEPGAAGSASGRPTEDVARVESPSNGAHGGPAGVATNDVLIPVTILAYPPAVQIFIDGALAGAGNVQGHKLPPGPHRLRLHHPSCPACADTDSVFEVKADAGSLSIKERIGFKPARLRVSSPSPGMVFVDGELAGRTNETLKIEARSDKPWKVAVKVLFDTRELAPYEGTASVQAGRTSLVRTSSASLSQPTTASDPVETP